MAVRIERLEDYAFALVTDGDGCQLVLSDHPDPEQASHIVEVVFTPTGRATLVRKLTGVTVVGAGDMPPG